MRTKTTKYSFMLVAIAATVLMSACSVSETTSGHSTPSSGSSSAADATPPASRSPHVPAAPSKKGPGQQDQGAQSSSPTAKDKSARRSPSTRSDSAKQDPAGVPPATPPRTQQSILKKLPGSTKSGACITVGSQRDVTSGTIAMGNFRTAQKLYKSQHADSQQPTVNFYVIPKHRSMPGVTITMTPVTAKSKSKSIRSKDVEPADIWKYYSVHLPVPASGTWRLDVRSGADRGCFKVTFRG